MDLITTVEEYKAAIAKARREAIEDCIKSLPEELTENDVGLQLSRSYNMAIQEAKNNLLKLK